ncbi:uncharacterized protein [Amphiura filiformis]|uniref:uncharacterized protein n=1 Tax=Amphiura filiformis TaxID=82378 RepID=UPI003B2268D3
MPNSGYHGLINEHYYGSDKQTIFPLGTKYGIKNLPNPAYWDAYIDRPDLMMISAVSREPRNKYSRHLNFTTTPEADNESLRVALATLRTRGPTGGSPKDGQHIKGGVKTNSVAPFSTLAKPTCGFFFSRETDNKKRRTGIPPADLVKWRYYVK